MADPRYAPGATLATTTTGTTTTTTTVAPSVPRSLAVSNAMMIEGPVGSSPGATFTVSLPAPGR